LIQSLADTTPERAEFAVDLLYRVAGDKAPDIDYQGKHQAAEFRAAWRKWHDENQATLDLAKQLAQPEAGYTVISTTALKANTRSKILEIGVGPHQPVRWEFDGPRYPLDVQILGRNRLLIAEYFDRRVTERDTKGNILWSVHANMPIACQRLPNGHTFIATRRELLIVDRDGKQRFSYSAQPTSIMAAQRLRNGQIALVTSGGRCSLLDPQGRTLKSFPIGGTVYTLGGNIDVLANGRVLVPLYNKQRVAEFDWDGNMHWSAAVKRPISVSRLRNGHTLVTCSIDYRVVELDNNGKEVWSYRTQGRPFRARRR
jgi:PQQ-like domain